MQIKTDERVENLWLSYPPPVRHSLLELRDLLFEVATEKEEITLIEEGLKWGEAAYQSPQGSTIRMDWKPGRPHYYSLFFTCSTSLVPSFREKYGELFEFEKNRAIHLPLGELLEKGAIKTCLRTALLYKKLKDKPLLGL